MSNSGRVGISVLGAGAWGLALADLLARNGHEVVVWDRSPEVIGSLRERGTIDRSRGFFPHKSIGYHDRVSEAIAGADVILSAVPSYAISELCRKLEDCEIKRGAVFLNSSKGIEEVSLHFPHQIVARCLGDRVRYGVIAGPSHAEEVTRNVPTAVVGASVDEEVAALIQMLFANREFRVYLHGDVAGVEIGGALKNVMAISAGISDGMGFGDNTKAALITRGVAEMRRFAKAFDASPETVAGLSGLGDLIVTANSRHSRNRRFGELLAQGHTAESALETIGAAVEGYKTTRSACELSGKHGVDMPIIAVTYQVIYEGLLCDQAVIRLLDRMSTAEAI